jgi:hypothetical protein
MAIRKDATKAPALALLVQWLADTNRTESWLAEILDVSRPSVYRWRTGEHAPDACYRRAIHDLSGGFVHFDDWYTDDQLRMAYAFSRTIKRRLARRGLEK